VELEVDCPLRLIEGLVRGDYDFVICCDDGVLVPESLNATLLLTVTPLVFVRRDHPLARAQGLTMASLAGWKLATIQTNSQLDAWLADAVGRPGLEIGFLCDDFELLGRVVEKSDMLCMTSDYVFRQLQRGLEIVPLAVADIDLRHRISCIQPASRALTGPARKILAMMKDALAAS
jgi:DNA-binding transcriptional LysR family regulator